MSKIEKQKFYFKEFREKIGLSQSELAIKLETQQSRIAKYESGNMSPSVLWLKKYCEVLNASPNFILFGIEPHLNSEVSTERLDHATAEIFKEAIKHSIKTNTTNLLRMTLLGYMVDKK